jgi:hypothetical protein
MGKSPIAQGLFFFLLKSPCAMGKNPIAQGDFGEKCMDPHTSDFRLCRISTKSRGIALRCGKRTNPTIFTSAQPCTRALQGVARTVSHTFCMGPIHFVWAPYIFSDFVTFFFQLFFPQEFSRACARMRVSARGTLCGIYAKASWGVIPPYATFAAPRMREISRFSRASPCVTSVSHAGMTQDA